MIRLFLENAGKKGTLFKEKYKKQFDNLYKSKFEKEELIKGLKEVLNTKLWKQIKYICNFSSEEGKQVINKELREIINDIAKYSIASKNEAIYDGSDLDQFCYDQDINSNKLELFYKDVNNNNDEKYWLGKIFDIIYTTEDNKYFVKNPLKENVAEFSELYLKVHIQQFKNENPTKIINIKDKINFCVVTVIDGRNYDFGGAF